MGWQAKHQSRIRGSKSTAYTGLLPCLCLVLLSACSQPEHDSIRLAVAGEATNLDPRYATDATSARVNRLIYARMVDFDAQGRPQSALAGWVQFAPRHYRFRLAKQGRRFHDGRWLTSRDVKATYDFVLDPANASPHRAALALIDRIEIIDEDRIDFFLKRPDPLFPGYLMLGILPTDIALRPKQAKFEPIGSGPMSFLERPEPGRIKLLRRSDNRVIELLRVPDATVRVLKLKRGEVDLLQNDLPAELVSYLSRDPEIQVRRSIGTNFAYLGFNLEHPDTGKIEVRQAIAHAINREAIIRYLFDEGARPAAALLPPDHWAGHPELKARSFDPERARELLAQAGYNSKNPLRLTYKTSNDALRIRLATVIQDQLAQVGIQVQLQTYDWGTFYDDIKYGRFEMFSLTWVGVKTPDIFRYVFHSSAVPPDGANRGRLKDLTTDTLIEAAEAVPDLDAQAALYRGLQERLAQLLPYVPLWYEDQVFVMRDGIDGYTLTSDGNYDGLITVQRSES